MGALSRASAALLLLFSASPAAAQIDRWAGEISSASARVGIPEAWIRRVMAAESGGRTGFAGRPITSRVGAMGLMQLMPGTWTEMRNYLALGSDPFDPHDNILAGAAYLRAMYDRFGYPALFAAYNAGPGRLSEHLASGRALPAETRAYVRAVAGAGSVRRTQLRPARASPYEVFAVTLASPTSVPPQAGEIFAIRR